MIQIRYLGILLLFGMCLFASFPSGAQGFLRAEGKYIVDGAGKKLILRGMGLGGWMLQEGYMYHLSFLGQQYRIKEKIEASAGKEKANQFYENWLEYHTTRADIDALAALGFNSIRLPMHYALYTLPVEQEPVAGRQTWLNKGFELTDSVLAWCRANKMYLILDLHAAPGGQGNDLAISDRNPSKPSLWQSPANQQKTVALWKKLAERYAGEPWIGGYDILNETNWGFEDEKDVRGTEEKGNTPLKKLSQEITKAIREADKNHLIIIEGNGFGNNYSGMLPPWDDNMALSFHKYGNFNSKESISRFLELRNRYNIPIWLGESGENSNTWFTEAIKLAEDNNIGWAWWQHKKMGINNPFEIKKPKGYDRLLAAWLGKGPRLQQEEAWSILQEWLENTKIENNIFHKDVADAMFRQVGRHSAVPFTKIVVGDKRVTVKAADYDLGAQRVAYFDRDSASYHFTPGVNTVGNKGRAYRNDGVDIQLENNEPFVFSIEDGEWLQYTLDVKKSGNYLFTFQSRSATEEGRISLLLNGIEMQQLALPAPTKNFTATPSKSIRLKAGKNQLKIYIQKGGFELRGFNIQHIK